MWWNYGGVEGISDQSQGVGTSAFASGAGGPGGYSGVGELPGGGTGTGGAAEGGNYGGTATAAGVAPNYDPSTGLYDLGPAAPAPTDVSANLADFGYSGSSLEESTPTGAQYSPVGVNLAGPTLPASDIAATQLFSGGATQVPAGALQDFANLTGIDLTPSDFGIQPVGSNPVLAGWAGRLFANAATAIAGPIGQLFNAIMNLAGRTQAPEFFAGGPGPTGYGALGAVNELSGGGPPGEGNGGSYSAGAYPSTPLAQASSGPSYFSLQFPNAVNPFTLPSVSGGVAALPLGGGAGGGGGTGTPSSSNVPAATSTFPWLWVVLLAALAVGGYLWWRAHHKSKGKASNPTTAMASDEAA